MLQVKNLTKSYGRGSLAVRALDSVNIDFPDAGLVMILGKSGCGKSTLLNMLGGLDRPSKGDVIIDGKRLGSLSAARLNDYRNTYIGFVFQNFNIIENRSVYENIELALKLQNNERDVTFIDDVLTNVGLGGLGYRKPSELSGGQRQRVAIARALIKNPRIILADEPTGAVDSSTGDDLFVLLKKLSKTKLVIVVTHDDDTAYRYGDRIISLEDGKIVSDTDRVRRSDDADTRLIDDNIMFVKAGHRFDEKDAAQLIDRRRDNYLTFEQDRQHVILAYPQTLDVLDTGYRPGDFVPHAEPVAEPAPTQKFSLRRARMGLANCTQQAFANIKKRRRRIITMILVSVGCMIFFYIAAALLNVRAEGVTARTIAEYGVDFMSAQASRGGYVVYKDEPDGKIPTDADVGDYLEQLFPEGIGGRAYRLPLGYLAGDNTKKTASNYGEDEADISGIVCVSDFGTFKLPLALGAFPTQADEIAVTDDFALTLCSTGYISMVDDALLLVFPENLDEIVGSSLLVFSEDRTQSLKITGVLKTNAAEIRKMSKTSDELSRFYADSASDYYSLLYGTTGFYDLCVESIISRPPSDANLVWDFIGAAEKDYYEFYTGRMRFSDRRSFGKNEIFAAVKGYNRTAPLAEDCVVISLATANELYYNMFEWKNTLTAKDIAKLLGSYEIRAGGNSGGGYIESGKHIVNIVAVVYGDESELFAEPGFYKIIAREMFRCDRLIIPVADNDVEALAANAYANDLELNNALFSNINSMLDGFRDTSRVLFVISGCIAFFVFVTILNFLLIMTRERRKETGIMRALGASGQVTIGVFFIELSFVVLTVTAISGALSALILRAVNSSLYYITMQSIVFVRLSLDVFLLGFGAFALFVFVCAAPILLSQAARQPIRIINEI